MTVSDEPFNRVDVIKHLVDEFEKVQFKFSGDGAYDSETSWVFKNYVRSTVVKREKVSTCSACWELYDTIGAPLATRALSVAADKVNEMLPMCTTAELRELDDYYGWDLPL